MKRTPLRRHTPPRAKRNKPAVRVGKVTGKIRLYGAAKTALRWEAYIRDGGCCQWGAGLAYPEASYCGKWLPFEGSVYQRAHMAHRQGLGASGSDVLSNVRILCYTHHIEFEHRGITE